jgi:hypothetical protein
METPPSPWFRDHLAAQRQAEARRVRPSTDANGNHIMTPDEWVLMIGWGVFGGLVALYGLVFF